MAEPFLGYSIAVSTIAVMIAASGIVLGIGIALDERKIKEIGRSELYQAVINGIIVASLFFAFSRYGVVTSLINNIASNASVNEQCSASLGYNQAICFAYNYLVGVKPLTIANNVVYSLSDTVIQLFTALSGIYIVLALIGSLKFSLIISISLQGVLTPFLSQLSRLLSVLTFALISIWVQAVLLKVVSAVAIPVLLPIGMVLRTFYFTRKLGGAIMAIAIGLFAVFPLTYVIDAQLTLSYSSSFNDNILSAFQANATATNRNILGSTQGSYNSNSIIQNTGFISSISAAVYSLLNQFVALMDELVNGLAIIIVEVFFMPLFSVVLTMISIREFAKILGAEVSFGRYDLF